MEINEEDMLLIKCVDEYKMIMLGLGWPSSDLLLPAGRTDL